MPLYTFARSPFALGAITALALGSTPIVLVAQFSYRLMLIPDELQGGVNSVFRLLLYGGQPLGLALAGVLAQSLCPVDAVLIFAVLLAVLALVATVTPSLRSAAPPTRAHSTPQ